MSMAGSLIPGGGGIDRGRGGGGGDSSFRMGGHGGHAHGWGNHSKHHQFSKETWCRYLLETILNTKHLLL